MTKSIFPETMLNKTSSDMTLEGIAGKLLWFEIQLHMIHWQTMGYSEHMATNLYDTIHEFTDCYMEKLMGYSGRKIKDLKIPPILPNANSLIIIREIVNYSEELCKFAKENGYSDLDNMSQELSGNAAKTLFLLTLS